MQRNKNSRAVHRQSLSPQLQHKLDRHFLACSATIGASLAVAAGTAPDAKGAIVYSGVKNVAIPAMNFTGIYFDFDTNSVSTSNIANVSDANIFDAYSLTNGNTYFYHSISFYGPNKSANAALATVTSTAGETIRLSLGATIGSKPTTGVFGKQNDLANQFYNYDTGARVGSMTGQWTTGGTGYLGFRFVDAKGQTDYGWMRVSFDPQNFTNRQVAAVVVDWAYNNAGGPITVGQVPEPSSIALGLLGAGAIGLAAWRNKRAQKSTDSQA